MYLLFFYLFKVTLLLLKSLITNKKSTKFFFSFHWWHKIIKECCLYVQVPIWFDKDTSNIRVLTIINIRYCSWFLKTFLRIFTTGQIPNTFREISFCENFNSLFKCRLSDSLMKVPKETSISFLIISFKDLKTRSILYFSVC